MKSIQPNIYPKSGYVFNESDGSKHVASSWPGVIARVKRYREGQGRDSSTVEHEVIFQACLREPILCHEDNGDTRAEVKKSSLRSRVLRWLGELTKRKPTNFVDGGLHAARTDVCIRCPVDKGMPGGGCGACKAAVRELQEEVVGPRQTDSRITACPILGEYLPVSTWLDEPTVVNPELPGECWRRRS